MEFLWRLREKKCTAVSMVTDANNIIYDQVTSPFCPFLDENKNKGDSLQLFHNLLQMRDALENVNHFEIISDYFFTNNS